MRTLFIFLSLLLAACAAITNANDYYTETATSWRWGHTKQLTRIWGQPTKITALPNGNKILVYEKESYQNYPAPAINTNVIVLPGANGKNFVVTPTPSNPPLNSTAFFLTCSTFFEIDPRNIIVDVRMQGNNCTADESFFISKSNPETRNKYDFQQL